MDIDILWAGCYRHQQVHSQTLEAPWVFLNVTGMNSCHWEDADGRKIFAGTSPGSYLLLAPGGARFSFDYSAQRENWICCLRGIELRQRDDGIDLRDGERWIALAQHLQLTPKAAQLWRVEMKRVRDLLRTPLPRNFLLARWGMLGILRAFLDAAAPAAETSPAQKFREAIDTDEACARSLSELAGECGYSADHLRLLFEQEFGIAPQAYRMQRRMTRAMELVRGSTLSVKEIAATLGFPYVPHFSTAFRQTHGCPPRDAIRRHRQV